MIKVGLCALLAALAAAQTLPKASHEIGSGNGVLDSGVKLLYKTVVERSVKSSAFAPVGHGYRVSGNTMSHFIYDNGALAYFGYEMAVFPEDSSNGRQVSFGPMVPAAMRDALKAVAGDRPLNAAPLPKYPPPQIVHDGDTIALDLMVSPDGRERIVDYIQFVFAPGAVPPPPAATAEPRDFTIDDGAVHYPMDPAQVFVDGKEHHAVVVLLGSQGGSTLWLYIPGRGRYILSLVPHEGFVKAGTVRAEVIAFRDEGRDYEFRMGKPIAGVEKAWNLYVMRDAGYLPRSTLVNRIVGSVDRLENLVPKR